MGGAGNRAWGRQSEDDTILGSGASDNFDRRCSNDKVAFTVLVGCVAFPGVGCSNESKKGTQASKAKTAKQAETTEQAEQSKTKQAKHTQQTHHAQSKADRLVCLSVHLSCLSVLSVRPASVCPVCLSCADLSCPVLSVCLSL